MIPIIINPLPKLLLQNTEVDNTTHTIEPGRLGVEEDDVVVAMEIGTLRLMPVDSMPSTEL